MKDIRRIKNTVNRISILLTDYTKQENDPGLLTGYCGSALFFFYYYKLTGKKIYLDHVRRIVEKAITALAEEELICSHCGGIAGMMWCLQHLVNNGLIEHDETANVFEEVDDFLFSVMKSELDEGNIDFLHQGLGITLYFLEKEPGAVAQNYLEAAAMQIEKACVRTETGITWKDSFTKKSDTQNGNIVYNLGLAHGMPAVLSVLSILHEKGIAVDKTLPLIEGGINWLLANKNKPQDNSISLFPCLVTTDHQAIEEKHSRLGWCYGDLSVATTLLNVGNRLQNMHYKQEARAIFDYTLHHRDKDNGSIADASLCHGSMGVSHLFRRAYLYTGDDLFLKGADHWLEQTLQKTVRDGLAGFKFLSPKGFEDNYNLLEGLAGIGLALITALDADITPAWDRCLLIS